MKTKGKKRKILVGNSFPFSLVRRGELSVSCLPLPELKKALADSEIVSFWGHANTQSAAEKVLGVSLSPKTARPALSLSPEKLPELDGEAFDTCWLLSPDYPEGFRPAIGQEVGPEQISGWHVLKLIWK